MHNFCDRDSDNSHNKRLMLEADDGRGLEGCLLHRILSVMVEVPSDSQFRYWLASCVEVFLRGPFAPHQDLVARGLAPAAADESPSALVAHLVGEILASARAPRGGPAPPMSSTQINFDLLGELMKFHAPILCAVDAALGPREEREEREEGYAGPPPAAAARPEPEEGDFGVFVRMMTSRSCLVDSNVFIRSVFLSAERFGAGGDADAASLAAQSRLCRAVLRRGGPLLLELMRSVEPHALNSENICVVNTLLVILIFARRRGDLADTLAQVRSLERGALGGGREASSLLGFRVVLDLWVHYYLVRPTTARDPRSLAYSTGLGFDEWVTIVRDLSGPRSSPLSLEFGAGRG